MEPTRPSFALPTLVACAAAGLTLVVIVGLQSPATSVGLRWSSSEPARALEMPKLRGDGMVLEIAAAAQRDNSWIAWVMLTLLALIALAIAYGVVLWIRHLTRRTPAVTVARTGADSGSPSEADAMIVKSGLAAALQILATERNPGNAVVQAWQGLQDAAAAGGLDRRPAETASEFTARILYRSHGSAEPIAVLLSLYQRVRFGDHDPNADEIAAARGSLAVLVDLWLADFPERRKAKARR